MPTECSPQSFDFGAVEGRHVEAAFDGGLVTSDAGALLLGATDRAIAHANQIRDNGHGSSWPRDAHPHSAGAEPVRAWSWSNYRFSWIRSRSASAPASPYVCVCPARGALSLLCCLIPATVP
jgi:hypothetical protein